MNTLLNFYSFVKEVNKENGRNYKLEVLRKYKDDEDIRYYLNFIFNPYIVTGISDKKFSRKFTLNSNASIDIHSVKDLLEFVKINNTGSDKVLEIIMDFITKSLVTYKYANEELYKDLFSLFKAIITKNLPIGVAILSINKIMNNLIPTFDVMLANKYFDNMDYVIGKEFSLTTKIDGGRIIALKRNGLVNFYTRAGQLYEGLVDLKEEMEKYMPDNICLDGEITLLNPYVEGADDDWLNPTLVQRKLSSKEQYKETMKITRKDGEKHGVKMLVFDILTADEFENQTCVTPYNQRRAKLDYIFNFNNGNNHEYVYFTKLPILYTGSDANMITEYLNDAINNDEEGIMINITDAPYEFKRTSNLLKVKKMQDIDLPIIGYEEGDGLNSGKLGAFLVDYKGYTVKVGGGYTKALREEVWKHPQDYLGLTISVQYFEETSNADGGLSLRFPVFLDFRYDK